MTKNIKDYEKFITQFPPELTAPDGRSLRQVFESIKGAIGECSAYTSPMDHRPSFFGRKLAQTIECSAEAPNADNVEEFVTVGDLAKKIGDLTCSTSISSDAKTGKTVSASFTCWKPK